MSKPEKKEKIVQNNAMYVSGNYTSGLPREKEPVVAKDIENRDRIDEFREDPEIQKLRYISVERTPQSLRWLANHDNAVQTSETVLTKSIIGSSGLEAKTENKRDKKWIDDYLERLDYKTVIHRVIIDCIPHAESIHWKDYTDEGIMLRWLDYLTLHRIKNVYNDKVKWIQVAHVDPLMPSKDGNAWKVYEPYLDIYHDHPQSEEALIKTKIIKAHIFEDEVVKFQLFTTPPMVTIADLILWKKWMQYDAKLGGQKNATPLIDASIELPDAMKPNDDEIRNMCDDVSEDLSKHMNHGVLAHLDVVKIQSITQSGQIFHFTEYLEYIDKQIHKTILVPKNLLEATGSELATSKTTKDVQSTVHGSIRNILVKIFEKLVKESAEYVGRKLDPFTLAFSEEDKQQRLTHNEEIMAILQLYDRGIIDDDDEIRGYLNKFAMELKPKGDKMSGSMGGDLSDFGQMPENLTGEPEDKEMGLTDKEKIENDVVSKFNEGE